jgi:flagellar biosynthesis protein FliR
MVSTENKINDVNYGVLAVFMAYILLDLFVKKQQDCIPAYFSSIVVANVFCGIILGSLVALCMYVSVMRTYLFINEINPNKEICTTPSTQQFRCSVYKNGELVGSSINS